MTTSNKQCVDTSTSIELHYTHVVTPQEYKTIFNPIYIDMF